MFHAPTHLAEHNRLPGYCLASLGYGLTHGWVRSFMTANRGITQVFQYTRKCITQSGIKYGVAGSTFFLLNAGLHHYWFGKDTLTGNVIAAGTGGFIWGTLTSPLKKYWWSGAVMGAMIAGLYHITFTYVGGVTRTARPAAVALYKKQKLRTEWYELMDDRRDYMLPASHYDDIRLQERKTLLAQKLDRIDTKLGPL
mmetsp:Transcript_15322/g.17031  ORF Transcript_15322/g.17031 Transcript_15322/m.17031 type:complete len:197 (-) Transcript_15322:225-815(-)